MGTITAPLQSGSTWQHWVFLPKPSCPKRPTKVESKCLASATIQAPQLPARDPLQGFMIRGFAVFS